MPKSLTEKSRAKARKFLGDLSGVSVDDLLSVYETAMLVGEGWHAGLNWRKSRAVLTSPRRASWHASSPLAACAHAALLRAIRRGRRESQPFSPCSDRKAKGRRRDHSRPSEVLRLCRRGHRAAHEARRSG
jgi:hypothetical protein